MTRASNYGLYDPSDYERSTFVIINDFDDCEDSSWKCSKCGCQIYVENTEAIAGAQSRHGHLFHCRSVQRSETPSSNDKTGQQFNLAQDKIPPHIILRYAHQRASSSRYVSDLYKVLSQFYGIPAPIVEAVQNLGYEDGRKILGAWSGNRIRFAGPPSLHTILHEYFHYYSFVSNGGKTSQKSTMCKTMGDARREELEANEFADKCLISFELSVDCKEEFRRLALKYHPDRCGDSRIFNLVKAAYDFLVASPPSSSPQSHPSSRSASSTSYQQQTENPWNPQSRRRNTKTAELTRNNFGFGCLAGIKLAFFRAISLVAGIFAERLLNLARILPWRYWKIISGFSHFTRTYSSSTRRIATNSMVFGIRLSILLADGMILVFLFQDFFFLHYFPPNDSLILQIGGALMGVASLVVGLSKTHFRLTHA